ncbi:NADAR family protein [Catalinimonas niigatensis]|uniref:peptidyl-prolyl cis-trans isomerase n=1 Tax=Catalinimonas niigatensis TaxID=1397264 RepID=UPI002665453D|nr:peptidyl-prolyl cis-trans isomerase [Catalinimonas niigatensis]WPP51042.1 peptidyl-prolyl cis-trans isomerase [Catalinimonas niigatensis]
MNKIIVLVVMSILLGSCNERNLPNFLRFKNQEAEEGEVLIPVARVFDNYLYIQDLEGIVDENVSPADSASIMNRYIDSWIRKQLIIAEAATQINFDEVELERKILDYRFALMVYEFEKKYVTQRVDTEISENEIKAYYQENKDNFELKQNIIKGVFAKVPKEAPRIGRLRNLFQSKLTDEVKEEIKSYSLSFAASYSLDDSVWYDFEDVIKNTPLVSIPNKVQFLRENEFIETSDDIYVYFVKVIDYKITDQISPIEFVSDDIVKIITNKRKVALTKKLEEDIFKEASENNEFEIYTPVTYDKRNLAQDQP